MDRQQRIDHYLQRISDKHFEIYDVRRDLEQQHVDEEEIKIIVRAVDNELQARLLKSSNPDSSALFIRIGIILMFVGAALSLAIVIGAINGNDFFIYTYATFFGGLSGLLIGLFKRKKSNEENSTDQSPHAHGKRVSFRKKSSSSGRQ